MEQHLFTLFKVELKSQLEFAVLAWSDLQAAIEPAKSIRAWYSLQGLLLAAANASKLLWGGSDEDDVAEVRAALRDFAGVTDDSPLRSRAIRNAFEHFDDRLVGWYEQGDTNVSVSRNVGPLGSISVGGQPSDHHFGNFDPATGIVTFLDQSVSVTELVEELKAIGARFG